MASKSKGEKLPSKLLRLPPPVWGQITTLLDTRSILVFGCTSPSVRNLLHSPQAVNRFHVNIPMGSSTKLTEWPTELFAPYPTLVSIGLSLNFNSKLRPFTKEDLANFGPSVRHLYLNFPDSIHDELIPYLPAMLLTLSLDKNHRITDAGLANLPNWLEALHLPNNYNVTSHCIPKLPRTLKNLSFWTKDAITPGIMSEMPSLTSLRVYGPQCLGGPAIEALPSSLATFAWCYDFYMNSLQIFSLPASVTELYIESIEQTPGAMRRIPSGLKRLTIVSPLSFNIYNFQEHLPKNLLYLDLLGVKTLATGSASCFPPTLVSLSLPSMITITRDEIMAFPKGLHILKMTMLTNFENEWFSVLPPSLHVFYCTWNEQISDDLVNHVPASLYRLVLRARAFPYRDSPETPSDQERLQPIDDYISLARSFPRVVRVHFNAQISHMAVWDLYYFEVDAAKKKLGIHDIVPRSVPSFAFSVIQRKPEPKGWFASLF